MKSFLIICIILGSLLALWLFLIAPRMQRPKALFQLKKWKFAHRGLHNIEKGIPENSLLAFQLARDRGFAMELDVHLSRDGKLVVEHDDSLRRTCGVNAIIEESNWESLRSLHLEGTNERLPLLEEVFRLIDGKVPLLIEVKVFRGNQDRLCRTLWQQLQHYDGLYCVEAFDPRALLWFRRHAPHVVRGQLAAYVRRGGAKIAPILDFAVRNLWVNVLSRPDFVAYNYQDRHNLSFQLCRRLFKTPVFFWTIRSPEGATLARRSKASPIFEEIEL